MKRFLVILTLIIFLVGCACSVKGGAKESVYIFMEKYKSLDKDLVGDVDSYVSGEYLNEEQKEKYYDIFLRQYNNMNFEIVKEEYEGDTAYVTVKVTVYDLFKAQDDAEDYLVEHEEEFLSDDGVYDSDKFMKYKLDYMLNFNEKVTHEIKLTVKNEKGIWVVMQPSKDDLAKIHGIYN